MAGQEINWKSVLVAAVSGFLGGALAASPIGVWGQIIIGGLLTAKYKS